MSTVSGLLWQCVFGCLNQLLRLSGIVDLGILGISRLGSGILIGLVYSLGHMMKDLHCSGWVLGTDVWNQFEQLEDGLVLRPFVDRGRFLPDILEFISRYS